MPPHDTPSAACKLEMEHLVADKLDPMSEKLTTLTGLVESLVKANTKLESAVCGKNLSNGLVLQAANTANDVSIITNRIDTMLKAIETSEKETKTALTELNKTVHGWARPLMGWIIGAYISIFGSIVGIIKWISTQFNAFDAVIEAAVK
jgi:hypothetical protein